MALIASLVGSSVFGLAVGTLAATRCGDGVRPCRRLRERGALARAASTGLAVIALTTAAAGIAMPRPDRLTLAITCAGVALLLAIAAWLLLVEPDDPRDDSISDEPEWWPTFERELEEWTRNTRRPVSSRS